MKLVWEQSSTILIFYTSLILLCFVVYFAESTAPWLLGSLELSSRTPWGIITSIFVHGSESHLVSNSSVLAFEATMMAILVNVNKFSGKSVSYFFIIGPIVAGILANLVQLLLDPQASSFGASGVAYAAIGIAAMASVYGVGDTIRFYGLSKYFASAKQLDGLTVNLLFCVPIFYSILQSPAGFLGVNAGVDYVAHGFGLIFGLLSSPIYFSGARLLTHTFRQERPPNQNMLSSAEAR